MARIDIELADGTKAGSSLLELTKQANTLNKEIKKLKPGTAEFIDKSKELQGVNGRIKDVKQQIYGTTEASNALKEAWDKYVPFSGTFNKIGQEMGFVKKGVGGLTGSFGLLRTAIIATGIGALVVLLGSLFAWFTKTERGADFLSKAMAAAGAAVNVLIDRASKLIDALIAFTTGNWSEAADKFGEATKGVTAEIIEETKAAWDLADALDALEELEGKLILVRERLNQKIADARLLAKDESLSLKERQQLLQQAINLREQLRQKEEEVALGYIFQALQVKNLDELQKKYGVTLDELIEKGEDVINVNNLGLSESQQADVNKAFESIAKLLQIRKAAADEQRSIVSELNGLSKKSTADELKENAAKEKALRDLEKANEEILKKDQLREERAEQQRANAAEREKKRVQESMALAAKHLQDKITNDEKEQASKEKLAAAIAMMEQEKIDLFNEGTNAVIGLLSADEQARKKNAAAIKLFTIGQIAVNLQNEIQGIWSTANQSPTNILFPGSGNVIAGLKTAFAVARAAASISRVSSQKFEWGGVLRGPSHRQGGIPIEAEGDEIILTKGVYRNPVLRSVASQINYAAGGRKFETGGPVNPMRDSGMNRVPTTGAAASPLFDLSPIVNKLDDLVDSNNRMIHRIKVINNLQETREGLATLNTLQSEADV